MLLLGSHPFFRLLKRFCFPYCVFFIRTHYNCFCSFSRVLFCLDFLAPTLVLDADSLVVSSFATCFSRFWVSSDGVGAFLLLGVISMSISLIRLFNSSTRGGCCGVSWVIISGCEFGVRFTCCATFVMCTVSFIVAIMSFLRLTVISRMKSFMFLFSRSLTPTMMESLTSLIIFFMWSFQFADLSDSESRVMSSWVSKVSVLFGPLS